MLSSIWCHLHNVKNMKNTHTGVLLLAKLRAEACNRSKWRKASHILSLVACNTNHIGDSVQNPELLLFEMLASFSGVTLP